MVLLVEKFNKFYSKLENFPHNYRDHDDAESLSASLAAFRSKVSKFLVAVVLKTRPRSGDSSLSWIKQCLELVNVTEKAFAKLAMEIEHPMIKWGANSAEEYLDYTLNMLDFLNLMNSVISHLSHAKLQLSYALFSYKNSSEYLKPIEVRIPDVKVRNRGTKPGSDSRRFASEKEMVIHEALVEVRSIGFWVSGVVLSTLVMNSRPYTEIKKLASGFSGSLLRKLNLGAFEERFGIEEVRELNAEIADRSRKLSGDEVAERLKRKVKEMERGTEEIGEVVDEIFSRVLAGRNHLLHAIRIA